MKVLVDTNILLRTTEAGHAQHQPSAAAIDWLGKRGHELVIVPQVLYEFWEHLVTNLSVKGKQAHDARLVAAMKRHTITHLLTYNTPDFSRYSDVTALTPVNVLSGTVVI